MGGAVFAIGQIVTAWGVEQFRDELLPTVQKGRAEPKPMGDECPSDVPPPWEEVEPDTWEEVFGV